MALSEARKRANAKYNAKAYDRIQLVVYKGKKEALRKIAEAQGLSVNGYIKDAIKAKIKADTGVDMEL